IMPSDFSLETIDNDMDRIDIKPEDISG
ncbi:unnamed protein product, partial [Didymodactylos carnosus]